MDEETGKPIMPGDGDDDARPVSKEELKSMSAFTEFIETLNLDDLGREHEHESNT